MSLRRPLAVPFALIVGCSTPAPSTAVRVAAAASLKPALEELLPSCPEVQATFAATGSLAAQVVHGGPFDVFLAADFESPRNLVDRGLAQPADLFRYGTGRLVVKPRDGLTLDLAGRGLAALAEPAVRKLALANPRHAPYGRAAEAALAKAGVLNALRERLVFGESAEQAAAFVHSGAADAGILPRSLADGWLVPADLHAPIEHAGIILKSARERAAAERFRDALLGPDGQAVLKRHGFDGPGA